MIISPPNLLMILICSKKKRGKADIKDLAILSSQEIQREINFIIHRHKVLTSHT